MTFVGLDLHKRYITACALDAGGGSLPRFGTCLCRLTHWVISWRR